MRILNEQEKRDALNEVLIELSKSQDILKEARNRVSFFMRLEDIYYNYNSKEKFRHYYSDIFSTLTLIDGDSSIGSLDILAQNIQTIKDGYIPKNTDENGDTIDIRKEIVKLYDHTNLDIARINYTKTMTNETMSELAKNRLLVASLEQKVRESEDALKEISNKTIDDLKQLSGKVQERQEDMQKEYITILGIFAAIVLAFTGGIVFSSSVLENIDKPSIYRISLIAFIIGLVFFNLIWVLIDFIRDINGKVIRRKWIWMLVNLILIGGIIGVCFSYKYGWFLPI
ncbi:hypothetical protein [Candidatus Merdisoma sp. JLR.KK006]|uniref:hypothetical protein n=1 Tax=Candidatus Merdisoma sp. JLR.KK006 TaxID=3112626 RepID=UPI002FEEC90B